MLQVPHDGEDAAITFLDTPGHEVFAFVLSLVTHCTSAGCTAAGHAAVCLNVDGASDAPRHRRMPTTCCCSRHTHVEVPMYKVAPAMDQG